MTELRDARLRKAMEQAPDAQERPGAAVRAAIHAAAHDALRPWWQRWSRRSGGAPWAAVAATVALATLVIVVWEDREVPGARDALRAEAPRVEAPLTRQESAAATAPAGPAAAPPADATAAAPAITPAPAPAPAAPPSAPPPPAAAPAPSAAPMAKDGPRVADRGERHARMAAAPAAGAPPAADPSAAPAPAAQVQPGPPTLPGGWEAWTQARIEVGADSVVVPREQAEVLAPLLARMLRSPAAAAALGAEAQLRIELAQGGQDLGVLELAGENWRWLPLRDAQQARGLLPEAALATALRAEAQRLLKK